LKLGTSIFKCRFARKGTNEKYEKLGQRGCEVVMLFLPTFRILGPLQISGTVEARNFNTSIKAYRSSRDLLSLVKFM